MTTKTRDRETIADMADRLSDAYSTDNYRNGWKGCITMLRRRGYNDQQVEAIIRSKWTRWAADASNKPYGRNTGADLSRFLDTIDRRSDGPNLAYQVRELTRETFPTMRCFGYHDSEVQS